MAAGNETFSESWYRIASQRVALHPGVRIRRQNFRGERWYVIEHPYSNEFFRIRPAAYAFVARLSHDRTVEEAWKECLERYPDEAPGQAAVIQLLSQLYFANLLQYEGATDAAQLFERYKKRKQREFRMRLRNIMFMRIPLLDPDSFLVRTLPAIGKLISPLGALIWLVTVGWALKLVADNFSILWAQGQGVLAPENLPLLYIGMVFVKTLHEFGHAYFCRKFGGEVHVMGIMLMIFTPVPYMDATSSWGFRSRWKRLLVGGAGMIVELFVAAIAMFVWAKTAPGMLHSLAYNIMFVASVSTVVFNINPLLRFDGYYMLSDLIDMPNLAQRAGKQLKYFAERWLFGLKNAEKPTDKTGEAAFLSAFGITSGVYRVIVFGGILLLLADRFLIIGIIMAIICAIAWVLVPLSQFVKYLASSPKLDRQRFRATAVTVAIAAGLLFFLNVLPLPSHFRAPGVIQARERTQVLNNTAGYVTELLAQPGAHVQPGQPLMRLKNPELEIERNALVAREKELQARLLQARKEDTAGLKPLASLLQATTDRIQKLNADEADLTIRAQHSGIWVAPGIAEYIGRWAARGTPLGLLVNPASFEFSATVLQADADTLFARQIPGAEVRLFGQAGTVIPVQKWKVLSGGRQVLPSPALGWAAGGEVPVMMNDDNQGNKAAEPFFEVQVEIPIEVGRGVPAEPSAQVALLHGRTGKIRFDLEPEPLLPRWLRRLWQLLQKRYGL
jgi:putative peptide zinc metalloprotease protein